MSRTLTFKFKIQMTAYWNPEALSSGSENPAEMLLSMQGKQTFKFKFFEKKK